VVIITFADIDAALRVIHRVRQLRPDVPIVSRAREQDDVEKLYAAGAAEVVPEALEVGVMLATHALALSGIPMRKVIMRLREMREHHYALLRRLLSRCHRRRSPSGRCRPAAPACGDPDTRERGPSGAASAKSIWRKSAPTSRRIRRRSQRGLKLEPELELIEGDVVVLIGTGCGR